MRRQLLTLSLAVLATAAFTGCATAPASTVPAGYTGPTAQLDDSVKAYGKSKADFFYAEAVDGVTIADSLGATIRRNQGRGPVMTPVILARPLVAGQPVKVAVHGLTHHAAPIFAIFGKVHEVKGVVEFTPSAGGRYVVRGELKPTQSSVWVEDVATSEVVGTKVEVADAAAKGAAK